MISSVAMGCAGGPLAAGFSSWHRGKDLVVCLVLAIVPVSRANL